MSHSPMGCTGIRRIITFLLVTIFGLIFNLDPNVIPSMANHRGGARCNLCDQKFGSKKSITQHQKATNYLCRIDRYRGIYSDDQSNAELLRFHDEKANLDIGARRRSKGVVPQGITCHADTRSHKLAPPLDPYRKNRSGVHEPSGVGVARYTLCVQDILNNILDSDDNLNRFEREADLEGSYKTGLKIGKPDEFDFSVGLRLPRGFEIRDDDVVGFQYTNDDADEGNIQPKRDLYDRSTESTTKTCPPNGYRAVKLQWRKARRFKDCVTDGILVPYEVLKEFHTFMTKTVDSMYEDLDSYVNVVKVARGPAVSLKIQNDDIVHIISVDITPVIYIGQAGDVLNGTGWPRKDTTKWLEDWKISAVLETDIYLVPKGDKFWKISFARCEDEVLKDIDGRDAYDGTGKKCLRICKMKLKQWKSKSESGMKSISSYMLKDMGLYWRLAVVILLYWICIITEVEAYCKEGESNYTERISYYKVVYKSKLLETKRTTRSCVLLFFCRNKQVTVYYNSVYPEFSKVTTENTTCCPGFSKNEEDFCVRGCQSGLYGDNCTMNCTCPENALDDCDGETGNCTCKSGWSGTNCNETCELGYYGLDCSSRCTCENNSTCDIYNGLCNCTTPGWYGESCENECLPDTYGVYCNESCQCNKNQSCDPASGNCTCKPGRTGTDCQDECLDGLFGQDCQSNCTCIENRTEFCNKTNGQCLCRAGFDGRNCDLDCPFGTFGLGCQQSCTNNCNFTQFCDPVDGYCLCIGSKGDNCSEECDKGTYGINCGERCNCLQSESCHPMFGNCSCPAGMSGFGCVPKGTDLDKDFKPLHGNADEKIDLTLILALAAVGVVIIGIAVVFVLFIRRKRHNKAKEKTVKEREQSEDSGTDVVENASYIPLEVAEGQCRGQDTKKKSHKNIKNNRHQTSELNSSASQRKDKQKGATGSHGVTETNSKAAYGAGKDNTSENVYDTTNTKIANQAVNTYNTFKDVERINNMSTSATAKEDEYNVLHEVKKPAKRTPENYDTFENVKLSQEINENAQEDTYNTLNENQTRQNHTTETYGSVKTKEKDSFKNKEYNLTEDVYENQAHIGNETVKTDAGDEIDVYENSSSNVNCGERFGSYENTLFRENNNEFKDDANVYDC